MTRVLQSPWVAAAVGGFLYLAVVAGMVTPNRFEGLRLALAEARKVPADVPSWAFRNPEFNQGLEEIKREKEELNLRAQHLQDLQTRLDAERQELCVVTQTVFQLQAEFDRNVIRIKSQEIDNIKRQAKIISGMSPDAAAGLVNEMPEEDSLRILFTMKPDEASAVIEAWSKMGKTESKRAAGITERMRRALPPDPSQPKTPP